ncbi:Uncharacterised protein [Klebsiella pneumoniae]|uniref:TgtA5 cluster protein 2 n=2 Tax=Klebsiella pneumoniae TaxID=573 RepID=A0A9J6S5B2_KLEPN|nr:hypothetical protein [Klebsiella pneumoniae]SSF99360.1 Uncharacterised protein [Klebsiella pneumoniae]HDZ1696170.1 hypothetical protein [Klebsiella pneumoniae]
MSTIHLITTCAKRKAGPVHDTVFPYHTTDTEIAYQQWKSLVQSRFTTCDDDIKETQNIYRSAHWSTAKSIATSNSRICLWVISAGLGLRHSSDPAIPYDATFTKTGKKSARIWEMLTSDPILPGKVPSLAELFGLYRRDIFIVAASPVYLNAVEDDLVKGVACLPCPGKQLRIASSASYNGKLREYVRYGGSRMMKDLNSNMTTLNIKHAGMLIHEMGIRPDTEC